MPSLLLTMILLPLLGSALNGLIVRTSHAKRAGVIGTLFAAGSLVLAILLSLQVAHDPNQTPVTFTHDWFNVGGMSFEWGFRFDALTTVMALVVTGIGTIIHLYSIGYMAEDRSPSRFFAYLNLFLFSMLVLITGDNLVVLFVGWEGVGLCSYLLIGYWYNDIAKANAGMKAFIVNRVGDAGFLLGIFLCYQLFGTLEFQAIAQKLSGGTGGISASEINLAALFLFIGAMGKSAQIPLYIWLPDAMAGPTPVSALIHAATMVTAGVYLIARTGNLFSLANETSLFIAIIGGATALFAALIATSQRDIKKVLAYSTVSQLGLMFLALGTGSYLAAIFHLVTHAFFKALLFLGAGSVIHGLHEEQDIMNMGGLRTKMPWTFWTFAIAWLAICGIPPLAGFFSKDMILYGAINFNNPYSIVLWGLGSVASLLTAFYMTRLFVLVFLGSYRGHAHPHESPAVMTIPLALLAVGSAFAGFLGLPEGFHLGPNVLHDWLSPLLPAAAPEAHTGPLSEFGAMGIATGGAIVAVLLGFGIYSNLGRVESLGNGALKPLRILFANKFYIDELYGIIFIRPFEFISSFLARVFDSRFIDATLLFPSRVCRASATALSLIQAGSAQSYLLILTLGGLAVLWALLKGMVI
jgi:NADH-quinone oxidoreductase subunit L